jgi:hypothetical protein
MSVPYYNDKGTLAATASSTGIAVPYFSSPSADDIALIAVMNKSAAVWNTPSGWSVLSDSGNSMVFWKRLAGTESGSVTLTHVGASGFVIGIMYQIKGCVTSGNPFEAYAHVSPGSSYSIAINNITTLGVDRFALNVATSDDDRSSNNDAATYSELAEDGTTTGSDGQIDLYGANRPTAGAVGSDSYTTTVLATAESHTFAMKPYVPPGYGNNPLGVDSLYVGTINGVAKASVGKFIGA